MGNHALLDKAFPAHTLANDGALVVEDARHDARFSNLPTVAGTPYHRSFLGAPLRTPDGTRIGTICAMDTVARSFSEIDGEIMEKLGKITVANLELRLIASNDTATGAVSRRSFMDVLGRELERHRRKGTSSALLVCHIDHTGDATCKREPEAQVVDFARHFRRCMRKTDTIGRVGPAALAVLLVDVGAKEVDAAIERLVDGWEESQTETVTASFGYAKASDAFSSGADWLAAADRAARSKDMTLRENRASPATHLGIGNRWINSAGADRRSGNATLRTQAQVGKPCPPSINLTFPVYR